MGEVAAAKTPAAKVAQAPVAALVEFDLLDFGSEKTTAPGQTSSVSGGDLFSSQPALSTSTPTTQTNHFSSVTQTSAVSPPPKTVPLAAMSTFLAQELSNNPPPATKPNTSNDDIMALFGPSKQQQKQLAFGMQAMTQMRPNNSVNTNSMMVNGIVSQQQNQTQQANMMAFNNQQNMVSQQQQHMMMMMQNNNMMASGNRMMPNQMMMQQQMANQFQSNNSEAMSNTGMYNSATNGVNNYFGGTAINNNNVYSATQGIQNMNMANTIQTSDDGGFGTPMGGNSQQQNIKNDAFSSLGGMNAFR